MYNLQKYLLSSFLLSSISFGHVKNVSRKRFFYVPRTYVNYRQLLESIRNMYYFLNPV